MARFLKSRKLSHGATPGSLIFIGNKKMEQSEIHLTLYNKESLVEKQIKSLDEIPDGISKDSVLWINIYGLQDTALIANLGERFSIPSLELEDILNTDQRPKIIENENNITLFLKVLEYNKTEKKFLATTFLLWSGKIISLHFRKRWLNILNQCGLEFEMGKEESEIQVLII